MKQKMNKSEKIRLIVRLIFILIIWVVSISLCFIWYDWKLALILMLFGWVNNIMLWQNKILPIQKSLDLIKESIDFK